MCRLPFSVRLISGLLFMGEPPGAILLMALLDDAELNPVEKLWPWLKKESVHNNLFESLPQLMDKVRLEYLKLTKKSVALLCNRTYR